MSKLRYKFLYEPKVQELHRVIKESEQELKELRGLASAEALKLQEAVIGKESVLREIEDIKQKKAQLSSLVEQMGTRVKEANEALGHQIESKSHYISSAKQEYHQEAERVAQAKQLLGQLYQQIEDLGPVAKELQSFVKREINARERYAKEQLRVDIAERIKRSALTEAMDLEKTMIQEKKDLDFMKDSMYAFYGKLATYVKIAKKTLEEINEALRDKAPIRFEMPPGVEEVIVDFKNFDKLYKI